MFDKFYHFSGLPFLLTPDPRFFFGSDGHSRAVAHLVYGLAQQEGFVVITGKVGSGKTMLTEQLWSQLDRNAYVVARVVTTQMSGDDLLRMALAGFGISDASGGDKVTLLRRFEKMARQQRSQGRRCLLIVDEAQNLTLAAVEELRMLSNFTVDAKALLQTILLGQPQFRSMLAEKSWEQLRQRVLASYQLEPLTEAETRGYIEHRLGIVDWRNDPVWEDEAFAALFQYTDGIPRRINRLCSRVLLLGASDEIHTITGRMVEETALELDRDFVPEAQPVSEPRSSEAARDDLLRRIEVLERGVLRHEQVLKEVMDRLQAGVAGRT